MNLTWEQLLDGVDVDALIESIDDDSDLPTALPIAERISDIPEGLPTAFIDKHAFLSSYGRQEGLTFGVEEIAAPVSEWTAFASTWLTMARWEPTDAEWTTGSLYVEFLSLAMVRYDNVPKDMWVDMVRSRSKGQFVYYRLKEAGWPYDLLRLPTRRVTQRMRDVHYARDFQHGADYHLNLPVAA